MLNLHKKELQTLDSTDILAVSGGWCNCECESGQVRFMIKNLARDAGNCDSMCSARGATYYQCIPE